MASSWLWPKILVWTVLVFLAFSGYGASVFKRYEDDLGMSTALGMAFLSFLGGLILLTSLASPALNIGLVLFGDMLFVWKNRELFAGGWRKIWKTETLLLLSGVLLSAYLWLYHIRFNIYDDFHAYLNFPLQILQTGTLMDLSFNDRALMSLGGNSYLQSLFLAVGGPAAQFQLEAVSAVILACIVWGMARAERLSLRVTVSAVPVLMIYPAVNSSALVSGAALFLAAIVYFHKSDEAGVMSFYSGAAILLSALLSLKSSFVFPAILMLIAYAAFYAMAPVSHLPRKMIARVAGSICLGGLGALPWMVLSRANFGTFLYPFLGGGYRLKVPGSTHLDGFGVLNIPFGTIFDTVRMQSVFMLPLVIMAGLVTLALRSHLSGGHAGQVASARRDTHLGLLLLTAVLINQFALLAAVGSDAGRYSFPFTVAVILFVTFSFVKSRPHAVKLAVLSFVLFLIFFGSHNVLEYPRLLVNRFSRHSALKQFRRATGVAGYFAQAQAQIPPGDAVFVAADCPFLLDFSRNRVFLCDAGATISLPPGMPTDGDPENMRTYFQRLGIKYVLYSKNEANFSREVMGARLSSPYVHIRTYAERVFSLFDAFRGLRGTALAFENEYVVLLDLDLRSDVGGAARGYN